MPRSVWILGLAMLLAECVAPARAGVVISLGSVSTPGPGTVDVAQGGTATIGVWVSSTASSGTPDVFNEYGVQLQISGPNFLAFAPTGSQDLVSYLSNPQYVFVQPFGFNNSFDAASGTPGGSVSNGLSYTNSTFFGADSTNDLTTVSLSSSSGYLLLASLIVAAPSNETVGSVYTLGLITSQGNTFFDQFEVPNSGVTVESGVSGQVVITPAAVVPEPASIVSAFAGMVVLAGFCGARRVRRFRAPWV